MTFIREIEVRVETLAGQVLRGIELMQALAPYTKEPAAAAKPARDLSRQEAFDLMMYHVPLDGRKTAMSVLPSPS